MINTRAHAVSVWVLAVAAWSSASCVSSPAANNVGIPIGVLLPYSGAAATEGPRAEPGLTMAIEMLNQATGATGQQFRVIIRDPYAGNANIPNIVNDMLAQGVVAIIGPNEVDIVEQVRSTLASSGTPYVLPGSGTLREFGTGTSPNVYQIAPPAEVIGCALANRAYYDGVHRLAIVSAADAYSASFASASVAAFMSFRQGQVGLATSIVLGQSHTVTIDQLTAFNPDAVALVGPETQAAQFVGDWVSSGHDSPWYLAPMLQTTQFLLNSPPNALSGAASIGIALGGESNAFAAAYRQRWSGDEPAIDAYFYFDAAILIGLATVAAAHQVGGTPTGPQIQPYILPVAIGPGTEYTWQQLGTAIQTLQAGQGINYTGASGPLSLDTATHALNAATSILQVSTVNGEVFTAGDVNPCPVGTPLGL